MDLKKIVENEDTKSHNEKNLSKIKSEVLGAYDDLSILESNLKYDLGLLNKCADEINSYFSESPFQKSLYNRNGSYICSPNTHVYNYKKAYIEFQFTEHGLYEILINMSFISDDKCDNEKKNDYTFKYTLSNESKSMVSRCEELNINLNPFTGDDFETLINNCDSDDELNRLLDKINKNINHIEAGLKSPLEFKCIYKFNNNSFNNFEDLFAQL